MPTYPGDPESSIECIQTVARDGWELRRIQISSHAGTHVNVPSHAVVGGRTLDAYALSDFCGRARIYHPDMPISATEGVLFRDQNIAQATAEKVRRERPRFVGLSYLHGFDPAIEKQLLAEGIISSP
jgi:arylformamidase